MRVLCWHANSVKTWPNSTKVLTSSIKYTKTNTHKGGGLRPPPQRGAGAFGARLPLWIPLWVLVFVYFVMLGKIFVLFGHLLTLLPYQQSRQRVYSFSSRFAKVRLFLFLRTTFFFFSGNCENNPIFIFLKFDFVYL